MRSNLPERPTAGRRRRAAFYATTPVLSGIILFVGLEFIGRLFDPLGISYYPETARYMDTLILEEPIGYRNRPGLDGRYFGAPVQINPQGMRDRDVSPEAPAEEFRVAVLGDSFPFGIGVGYEDSIPAVVEDVLNENAPPGRRFRTLNFGVPSYNTEQELMQLESSVLPLLPRAVVLLYALNDIFPKMWVFEKRRGGITNIAQRSYAVTLLFASYRLAIASPRSSRSFAGLEDYRPDSPRWLAIDRSLVALNGRCRAAGIPFVVVTYDDLERKPVAMVRSVGQREGFPVVNIVPWRDPRWRGRDPRSFVNSSVDSHPNPEGSRIYGRMVAEALQRLGVVPRGDAS